MIAAAVVVLLATVSLSAAAPQLDCTDASLQNCGACKGSTNSCVWCAGMIHLTTAGFASATKHDVKMGACLDTGGDCTAVTFGSLADAWGFTDTELGKLGSSDFVVAAHEEACGDSPTIPSQARDHLACDACLDSGIADVRWCQTTGTVTDIGSHEGGVCINQDLADAGYCVLETELTDDLYDTNFPLRMFVRSEVLSGASTSCPTTTPPAELACGEYASCSSCGQAVNAGGCEWCYGVATVTKTGDVIGELPLAFGMCVASGGTCDVVFPSVDAFFAEYYASPSPANSVTSVTVAMKTGGEAAWCAEQDSLMDPTLVNSDCHSCQSSETAPGTWCSLTMDTVTAGGMCQTTCVATEFLAWSNEVLGHEIEVADVTTCPSTTTTTTTEATTSGAGRAGLLVGCPLAFAAMASLHAI